MQDIQTTVLGVVGTPTQNGGTRFDVSLGDGQSYATFKQEIANKANALVHQQVTARIEHKPKRQGGGFFLNLEDIGPVGSLPPMAFPAPAGMPAQQAAPSAIPMQGMPGAQQIPMAAPQQGADKMTKEEWAAKDARITRSGAAQAAFQAVANVFAGVGPEAMSEVRKYSHLVAEEIVRYAETGSWDGLVPGFAAGGTPDQVAAAVNQAIPEAVAVGAPEAPQAAEIPWQ